MQQDLTTVPVGINDKLPDHSVIAMRNGVVAWMGDVRCRTQVAERYRLLGKRWPECVMAFLDDDVVFDQMTMNAATEPAWRAFAKAAGSGVTHGA